MQPVAIDQITVDEIFSDDWKEKNIGVSVLRLDKIHPVISGNKWFKLKYYIEEAKAKNKTHLVTSGGAYSNHLIATAAAGKLYGFKTTGIVRGEQPQKLSETLEQSKEFGMELIFSKRDEFGNMRNQFQTTGEMYFINQGGFGQQGVTGAAEILDHCKKKDYSHICCAVGTTTMMAGLIKSANRQAVLGFVVIKNVLIEHELRKLLPDEEPGGNFQFIHDYHFGGYAKKTAALTGFMNEFYRSTGIPSDFVYTAKLFYGVTDRIKKNFFPAGSRILMIHSGGLQGNRSLPKDLLIF